ncbi:flagella basal body P-ring formation protein FlgA [Sphingobium lignivorans]|uniref:Flagella basal body P-ring formation protein FlgA n=1 Tax=Sphingobium lignivorans TaxID=2735886 RepID=A0ABR6NDE9_9SPHN|nr:flagella basal body P-ring formation protein FlgA [Sphingobium lignivorans]
MTDRIVLPIRAVSAVMTTLIGLLLIGLVSPARAATFENLDRLDTLVAMSVGAALGEPGGPIAPIDRRLRLAPCPQTPLVEETRMSAAIVSCPSAGWRLRVPLAAVSNTVAAPVAPVAAHSSPAIVVKKGDPVQLVAGNDFFSVSRLVIADEDGAVGALIRVRQDPKAMPVMARVEALGIVRIPGI